MKFARGFPVLARKYLWLGPLAWVLSVQYFIVQGIVAASWSLGYSWANHLISDLGNTVCGPYADRYVCSPLHGLMNASFVLYGITIALGAVLIYQRFQKSRVSQIGFTCLALSGIGTILVGLFPENTVASMHATGAFLALGIGNVGIILLALALQQVPRGFRIYTAVSGAFSLLAFALFATDINFGLGQGNMERLISYPFTIFLILTGIYLIKSQGDKLKRTHIPIV